MIFHTTGFPYYIGWPLNRLHLTPSIGIVIFSHFYDEDNDSETVLEHTDTAMYGAKALGRNRYEFFNPEMHVEVSKLGVRNIVIAAL